jgi:Cdc6-like AAA superfamily ATPase
MVYYITTDKTEPKAKQIATITTNDGGKVLIYIAEDEKAVAEKKKKHAIVSEESGSEIFPFFEKVKEQNHRLMVTGSSGSGKSTLIGRLLDQMIKNKPRPTEEDIQNKRLPGQVVIFSAVHSDPPLDKPRKGLDPIRIDLENTELFDLTWEDFDESIVIFDDIEYYHDKKVNKKLLELRSSMFERSRHMNTDLISVSHLAMSGSVNKTVKSEMTGLFVFPQHTQAHQTKQMLKLYMGLNEAQILRIMALPSRFVYISNHSPHYVVYKFGVYLL